ncbi:hypothetical protein SUDANB95_01863 [Actinosynnema sp. ALI-1.44]
MIYTDTEARTLRTAVFGAMVLVSTAEPGALDQESHAGIRALATFSPALREVLSADHPVLPEGTVADVEAGVLTALRRSTEILSAKSPADARTFPEAVLSICREVATADGFVGEGEHAVIRRVREALTG